MPELFPSYRKSPAVPAEWKPRKPPGAVVIVAIKNGELRGFLREILPGKWVKVYHYGEDDSEVHYCRHESGKVFDVQYHRKLKR